MKKYNRVVSVVLVIIMIVTEGIPFSAKAKAATETEIYKDESCRIRFKVNSEWESGL